jgi:hypothetical protein
MKKIILGILMVINLSCNSKQEKVEDSIKLRIDSTFNDPKSYEPIEVKILDTVGLEKDLKHQKLIIKCCKSIIGNCNFMIKMGNSIDIAEASKEKKQQILKMYDAQERLRNLQDFKVEKLIKVYHKFRAKNSFGAIVLQKEEIFVKIKP